MNHVTRPNRIATFGMTIVFVLSTVAAGPGCSLLFVDGPPVPSSPGSGTPDCTTTVVFPALDTILAGYLLVNMLLNASKPAASFGMNGEQTKTAAVAFGVGFTGLAAVSAGVGYSRVSACKEYQERDSGWTPPPRPSPRRRRPPPPVPEPAEESAETPAAPASGAAPPAYPAAAPGAAPDAGAVPVAPPVPATPPARQIEDDEAPSSGPRPRSNLVLPATVPMVAAMPRLQGAPSSSGRPRFSDVPRLPHPWEVVGVTAQ